MLIFCYLCLPLVLLLLLPLLLFLLLLFFVASFAATYGIFAIASVATCILYIYFQLNCLSGRFRLQKVHAIRLRINEIGFSVEIPALFTVEPAEN